MKLDNLRQLIKEELTKVLNEDTFHNGETVLHAGQRFTVVKDDGNIGVQVKTDTGKIKMINRSQLKRVVKEDNFRSDGGLAVGQYEVSYKVKDEYGEITQDTSIVDVTEDNKDESLFTLLKFHPDNQNRKVVSIYNYKPI
jgi:hypothetical protein